MKNSKVILFLKYHFFSKIRTFIKNTYRKYFLWYDYWTEKKLDDRRDRQNAHFRWTDENVQKINQLNIYLTGLMEEVYSDCENLKNQFDEWIAEGKNYYKNYEITGSIVYLLPDSDELSRRQNNLANAQDDNTDSTAWCIRISNKGFCKTELSKAMQFKNWRHWDSELTSILKEHGIEKTCSYVDAFLRINHGYSLKDFVKMKEENFCKNIEVKYVS